jgi:hypothetical protein
VFAEFFKGYFNRWGFLQYFFEAWDRFNHESAVFDFVDDLYMGQKPQFFSNFLRGKQFALRADSASALLHLSSPNKQSLSELMKLMVLRGWMGNLLKPSSSKAQHRRVPRIRPSAPATRIFWTDSICFFLLGLRQNPCRLIIFLVRLFLLLRLDVWSPRSRGCILSLGPLLW